MQPSNRANGPNYNGIVDELYEAAKSNSGGVDIAALIAEAKRRNITLII